MGSSPVKLKKPHPTLPCLGPSHHRENLGKDMVSRFEEVYPCMPTCTVHLLHDARRIVHRIPNPWTPPLPLPPRSDRTLTDQRHGFFRASRPRKKKNEGTAARASYVYTVGSKEHADRPTLFDLESPINIFERHQGRLRIPHLRGGGQGRDPT